MKSVLVLLVALFMGASGQAADDTAAIVEATSRYVKKEMGIADAVVTVEKIAEGYARVQVTSKSAQTDPATAYLKQGNSKWKVLILGTGFAPEDFTELGIPASVQ